MKIDKENLYTTQSTVKERLTFTEIFDFENSIKECMNIKAQLKYYAQDKSDKFIEKELLEHTNISYNTLFLFEDFFKIKVIHTLDFNQQDKELATNLLKKNSECIHSLFQEFLHQEVLA